ncbi:MAG: Nif3-like dinuclear metal center hexameric protein [Candidatus Ancillula sp.]|jgi:dinuclear metal center YbgI/SA1388 family protein|nr:Nif3-like dinuclear metal center hexameric protein [Candidatus Ancillula sp.]
MKLLKLIEHLESLYPLNLSEDWDFPGLCVGDVQSEISTILLSVDITDAVVDEAIACGANLLITHHPLFFRSVHLVGGDTFRGRILNKLIKNNISHYVMHTNADNQIGGVRDTIQEIADSVQKGTLLSDYLIKFKTKLDKLVPKTAPLMKVCANDMSMKIYRPYAIGGSGDSFFLEAAQAFNGEGADLFITSDLRHHPVQDAIQQFNFAIVDIPHFVSEYPWLHKLKYQLHALNQTLDVKLLPFSTDPWNDLKTCQVF